MNQILFDMMSQYDLETLPLKENAFKEVCQSLLLVALSHTDFFDHAAFYGGTCLRIFHGLDRFSEDLDFAITSEEEGFSLTPYLPAINRHFGIYGLNVVSSVRAKSVSTNLESGIVESNAREAVLSIFPKDPDVEKIVFNQKIKIKFEISKSFIPGATFERKTLRLPEFASVRLYDRPSLFSGKLGAVLCREWKSRVKGRDYYDFAFYVARRTKPNLVYLEAELKKEGVLAPNENLTPQLLHSLLKKKIGEVDFNQAKADVIPFVSPRKDLNFWKKEFFLDLVDELIF